MSIVKKVILGKTHMGRDIVALKVTRTPRRAPTTRARRCSTTRCSTRASGWPARPASARCSTSRATTARATPDGAIATELVNTRELWFVCVNNPDGYEYTFTPGNRLWRKNMADNNGNGVRGEPVDGVDINRNHATHWGFDNEGSSRRLPLGDLPRHRPGLRARDEGDQEALGHGRLRRSTRTTTPRPSCCCGRTASSSTRRRPTTSSSRPTPATTTARRSPTRSTTPATEEWEITGHRFDPDIGAELYITNGDLTDDAYANGILAYTPEGSSPNIPNVSGFEFQDVEADIQAEFLRHKEFVLDLARSADDPANPISHLGNTVQNFYVETLRGLLRRPAGRAGRGQEVARRRQAALPDQRRRGEDGRHGELRRRRALRPGARPLLPPPARHGHGHEPR